MSDYPMLISNKLHSFRNFFVQMTRLARGFLPMEKMMEMASCRLQ